MRNTVALTSTRTPDLNPLLPRRSQRKPSAATMFLTADCSVAIMVPFPSREPRSQEVPSQGYLLPERFECLLVARSTEKHPNGNEVMLSSPCNCNFFQGCL